MRRSSLTLLGGVRHALSCSLVVLSCVSLANAAPISYDEAVDGDLPNSNPLPILALDVGTNTVTGTLGIYIDSGVDADSFAFSVPASTQLVSAELEVDDASGDLIQIEWGLYEGSANVGTGTYLEDVDSFSPGSHVFSSVPLGPNTYNLTLNSFVGGTGGDIAAYTFTFVVESTLLAVPEPSTLILSAFGLMGFAFRRRRQRK